MKLKKIEIMNKKNLLLSIIVVLFIATGNLFAQIPPSGTFSLDPTPTQYNLTVSANEYCAGLGIDVFLDNSQFGIDYELYESGNPTASIVAGTGAGLVWNGQLAGTYTIVATNSTTGCSSTMNGSEIVIENTLPTQYNLTVSANEYCAGSGGVDVQLANSDLGVNYDVYASAVPTLQTEAGTGAGLVWNGQMAETYTIVATDATTGCSSTMNGSEIVIENTLPTQYNLTVSANEYCAGSGGVDVQLANSDLGVNYDVYASAVPTLQTEAGTGAGLVWNGQMAETYTIVATDATTGCSSTMNGSEIVIENTLPLIGTVTPVDLCDNGSLLQVDITGLGGGSPLDVKLYANGYAAGDLIHTEIGVIGATTTIFVDVSLLPLGIHDIYGISVSQSTLCESHDEQ